MSRNPSKNTIKRRRRYIEAQMYLQRYEIFKTGHFSIKLNRPIKTKVFKDFTFEGWKPRGVNSIVLPPSV